MHYIVALIGAWLAKKIVGKIILVSLYTPILLSYVAIFTYFLYVLIEFYNRISAFLQSLGNTSSSDIVDKFLGVLSCIGFTDALYQNMPILMTSVTTLLLSIFYQVSLIFYSRFIDMVRDVVK